MQDGYQPFENKKVEAYAKAHDAALNKLSALFKVVADKAELKKPKNFTADIKKIREKMKALGNPAYNALLNNPGEGLNGMMEFVRAEDYLRIRTAMWATFSDDQLLEAGKGLAIEDASAPKKEKGKQPSFGVVF